jgi:catechol 2,3-dioxygenase-like lactoylglutathione lyase family enzyme
MEINGVAHTFITAGDFDESVSFYRRLLPFLGMQIVADTPNTFYGVGGRTGFGIQRPAPEHAGQRFTQGRIGLHHHCFRARLEINHVPGRGLFDTQTQRVGASLG